MTTDAVRAGALDASEVARLRTWVAAIEAWPAGSHVWGHYAEQTPAGPAICRTENVSACHEGVAALVDGTLRMCAQEALGEAAVAFKDKVNYKQPGGAGFGAHQDRRAYPGATRVMSILVAIDPCTEGSGCLWLADGVDNVLPVDARGVVREDVRDRLDWRPIALEPGDAVCIDGLAPHFSESNRTAAARRVIVASYAPAADGYDRGRYYASRAERMRSETERDGRFRISTLADFEGVEVDTGVSPPTRCTH